MWAQTIGLETPPELGEDSLFDQVHEIGDLSADERLRVQRLIAQRRGQRQFSDRLRAAYAGCCAITGPQPRAVVEAAHIQPYRNDATHAICNGLLLRVDLHRLFDAHLLAIVASESGLIVRVAPELLDTAYGEFDRRPVAHLPRAEADRPHPTSLAEHQKGCLWLLPRGG